MSKIKTALIQTDIVWENTQANLRKYEVLFENIDTDTDLIILPEVFDTGFTMQLDNLEKPIGQKAFNWLQQQAQKTQKVIVGSTLFEEDGKYYNRMFWMRPEGSFDYYDKRHLFQMGEEDKVITQGKRAVIVPYKNMNFMLQICYDLRFPVWIKNRYDKQSNRFDYDVLLYIANWPEVRKPAYMALLKARAIENQAYVIWVNRVGTNNKDIYHSGDSQVLDADGNVVAQMPAGKESVLYFDLDSEKLNQIRQGFKTYMDWDTYSVEG